MQTTTTKFIIRNEKKEREIGWGEEECSFLYLHFTCIMQYQLIIIIENYVDH